MATLRKHISNIRSTHRLLNTDNSITDRAIAAEIISNSNLLIKRETNLRKLWATDTLFTTLSCLEMIEVPISECSEYVENKTISRSKEKLPKFAEGTYQYIIQGIYSINVLGGKGKKLKEVTINRYLNLLKVNFIKQEEYYIVTNGYLYVTNSDVKAIRIVALFDDLLENNILYPESSCSGSINVSNDEYCKSPLDREYSLPSYLEKQMADLVSQKLLNTYFRIKQDQSQDGIDSQAINSKPTN